MSGGVRVSPWTACADRRSASALACGTSAALETGTMLDTLAKLITPALALAVACGGPIEEDLEYAQNEAGLAYGDRDPVIEEDPPPSAKPDLKVEIVSGAACPVDS